MNRIVVITGTSSGIGHELAQRFLAEGDTVCGLSRTPSGGPERHFCCDVTREEDVARVMAEIGMEYGRIDLLINNAGAGLSGALELLDTKQVHTHLDLNLMGALYCIQRALPFIPRSGRIINISSVSAFFPLPFRGMYCVSKAALNMLTFSLRMELAQSGVQVCAICPGDIHTGFSAHRVVNDRTNERYGERPRRAAERTHASHRMDSKQATDEIYRIIHRKHLKPAVIIGGKYRVFYILRQIVPLRLFLWAMERMYGGYE